VSTITLDGKTRVTWVAAVDGISDIDAPKVSELNAGTDMQSQITPDGLGFPATTGKIDNSNLGSTFTTQTNGRRSFDPMIKFHRTSATGDQIRTIMVYGATGFVVIRRGVLKSLAWTAGQEVQVYPVEVGEPSIPVSAAEQNWDMEVPMTVSDDPSTLATVAA
jgi:hypothetical protein